MRLPFLVAALALGACTQAGDDPVAADNVSDEPSVESAGGEVAAFGNGVQTITSDADVATTVERLETALEEQGFSLVAKLDHQQNAAGVDLELPPTVSIFFGKPEVGTFMMQAAPGAALDLPQRMAIYEDGEGQVTIAYNSPVWLASRHGIEGEEERLDAMATALEGLAEAAAGQADNGGPSDGPMIMEEETN